MVIYVRLQQQPLSTRVTLFYLGSHQANGLGGERLYASTSFFQKKNCDEFSGVHRNPQNYESESGGITQKRWRQETNHRTGHHKKNCDKDSGVHCNYQKTMEVKVKISPKKDGDKK